MKYNKLIFFVLLLITILYITYLTIRYNNLKDNYKLNSQNIINLLNSSDGRLQVKTISENGEDYICLTFPYSTNINTQLNKVKNENITTENGEYLYKLIFINSTNHSTRYITLYKYIDIENTQYEINFPFQKENCHFIKNDLYILSNIVDNNINIYFNNF